jgi:hypothetical protein
MPWPVIVADLLASEYHWTRREIWWDIPIEECTVYVKAITHRKMAENGQTPESQVDDSIINLLDIIRTVQLENKAHG